MIRRQKKSVQALNYLANKEPNKEINRLKAMKLLWLADKYHLLKHRRTILKDKYYAMPHGPVPSATINISRANGIEYLENYLVTSNLSIKSVKEPDLSLFSVSDLEAFNYVWERFGKLSQWDLEELSHKYPEWKRFEELLKRTDTSNSYPMDMNDFYELPESNPDTMADFFDLPADVIFESKQTFYHRTLVEKSPNR
ncbi:MAG TPA: Panacea domain-containing protein [Bacteroidia bacterium]|nr:Panacea domain-containing protein [Bacteroidia bacterium]